MNVHLDGGAGLGDLRLKVGLGCPDQLLDVLVLVRHVRGELLVLVVKTLHLLLEDAEVGVDLLGVGLDAGLQPQNRLSMFCNFKITHAHESFANN